MAYTKEILTLAVEIGDCMLRNGAEIYRVEDTVVHILSSYEVEEFDVYVLSNGIFASANENKEDACSIVRHVPLGAVNLAKISALNQLARDICDQKISLIDSWDRLEQCKNIPNYKKNAQIFFCGLGSACFGLKKYKFTRIITNILASLFVTLLATASTLTGLSLLPDKIIIGAIMPLVPGIAFTTSIRDIYNGDYLSGTIHLLDALITAVCVAVGACLPFVVMKYIGGI